MTKTPSIYLHDSIAAELCARGNNRSAVINRDLGRLYVLYRRALRQAPLSSLSIDEICLVVDVLNGSIHDANTAHMLWAGVEDGIRLDGLAEKWDVDGPALVEKLRALNDIQSMALIDVAERFWEKCSEGDIGDIRETIRRLFAE